MRVKNLSLNLWRRKPQRCAGDNRLTSTLIQTQDQNIPLLLKRSAMVAVPSHQHTDQSLTPIFIVSNISDIKNSKDDMWNYLANQKKIKNMVYIYILHIYSLFELYPRVKFHQLSNTTMKAVPMRTGREERPSSLRIPKSPAPQIKVHRKVSE